MIWRVNREQVLLLGGPRALLMQVAHPMVAEAVYEHSYVFQRPVKRLLRTLELTLALVYGTSEEVMQAARTINQTHHQAKGTLSENVGSYKQGEIYDAQDPDLTLWVYATLVEGALSGYERFIRPLTYAEKQAFYEDSALLVALLGVKKTHLPPTIDALYTYMDEMMASGKIVVSRKAQAIAPYILAQTSPLLKLLTFPSSRLTVGLLPEMLREAYGFHYTHWEEMALSAFCNGTQRLVPHLPNTVRYVTQYRRAVASLNGRGVT